MYVFFKCSFQMIFADAFSNGTLCFFKALFPAGTANHMYDAN